MESRKRKRKKPSANLNHTHTCADDPSEPKVEDHAPNVEQAPDNHAVDHSKLGAGLVVPE
jgi:hypothetical protein